MTWEEVTVPALRDGELVTAVVRFDASSDLCTVEVSLDDFVSRGESGDLFLALVGARRGLEARNVLLGCNGARRDVSPSAMQRQAGLGRRAYVHTFPRTAERLSSVDIFATAPDMSVVATVDEQRAWLDSWVQSGFSEKESS